MDFDCKNCKKIYNFPWLFSRGHDHIRCGKKNPIHQDVIMNEKNANITEFLFSRKKNYVIRTLNYCVKSGEKKNHTIILMWLFVSLVFRVFLSFFQFLPKKTRLSCLNGESR
jgi:hypothetical protein